VDEGQTRSGISIRTGELVSRAIHGKLAQLRWAIRAQLFGEGLAWVVTALAGLIVVTLLGDWGLHRLTHLPVGRAQRGLIAAISAAGVAFVVWRQFLRRLLVPLQNDDLALLVERQYAHLNDRLISALQFSAERRRADRAGSPAMIAIVAEQANAAAAPLDFLAPLNARPLLRRAAMALAAAAHVAALWVLDADTMNRWFRRNILLAREPWPQETYLHVDGGPTFTVLRGKGLRVVVSVLPKSKVVPKKVVFHIRYSPTRVDKDTVELSSSSRTYVKVFSEVTESFTFRVKAHDYESGLCRVNVVQPAELTKVKFKVHYPSYTRLPSRTIDGASGMLRIPPGSKVTISATSTKTLKTARILLDGMEVGRVTSPKAGQRSNKLSGEFRMVPGNADKLLGLLAARPIAAAPAAEIPAMLLAIAALSSRPATMQLHFALTDKGNWASNGGRDYYPIYLLYDKPPTLTVQWGTLSKSITPNAMAPMTLDARDDEFGVVSLTATVSIEGVSREPLEIGLWEGPPATQVPLTESVVDLKDLGLHVGDVVLLGVRATDSLPGDDGKANVTVAGEHRLVVVTEKTMLKQLLAEQWQMSRHMNSAIQAQRAAIDRMKAAADQAAAGGHPAERRRLATESARSQQTVDSYAASIVETYERIRTIVIHNRLEKHIDPGRLYRRIGQPLAEKVREPIPALLAAIDAAGSAAASAQLIGQIDRITQAQQALYRQLQAVKREMAQLKEMQELARMLSEVITVGEEVKDGIQRRLKEERGSLFDPTSRPATQPTGAE